MKRTETIASDKIALASGRKVSERDRLKPLGDPKKVDFYELAPSSTARPAREGNRNPSGTLAHISGVALATAQGRVTKARDRELVLPVRRGGRDSRRQSPAVHFFPQ